MLFSRAVPNGKKFNLSGVDPFKTIILPLARALDHTLDIWKGHQRQSPQYPTLLLLISFIDAPIILVEAPDRTSDPVLTPWLRVVRQEAVTTETKSGKQYRFYAVDIVHAGYLNRFVTQHLLPLCDTFAERALKRGDILLRGGEVRTWTSGDGIRSVQGVVDNAGAGATQGSMLSAATPRSAVTRPKSMPPSPLSVLRAGALRASRRASRSIAHPEARPRTDLICRTTHATSNCCGCCGLLRIDAPAWRKW